MRTRHKTPCPIHSLRRGGFLANGWEASTPGQLAQSARHKSGFAMRFPRINRIRRDKKPGEADRLEALAKLAR